MIIRIIFFVLVLIMSLKTTAQNHYKIVGQEDQYDKRSLYFCDETAYYSSKSFVQYMQSKQYDSASYILNNWERECGIREPIFRARVMLAMARNQDADMLIDEQTFNQIFDYESRAEMLRTRNYIQYDYGRPYYGYIPIGQEFDSFLISFFKGVYEKANRKSVNYLLSEYYSISTDSLLYRIQSEEYIGTNLYNEYYRRVNKYLYKPELHYAFLAGIWIPTGDARILGMHPEVGMQVGAKYKKINIDLTVAFKFLKSKTPYYATRVRSDKSVVYTDDFFGGYFGLDGGYDIITKKNHEVQLLTGIGIDGFDAIEADTINNLKSESTWTYNFNFGCGYRYYFSGTGYIGLQCKYNIVNYALRDVIDFTGNPITIRFVIGGLSNTNKNYQLNRLKYRRRY